MNTTITRCTLILTCALTSFAVTACDTASTHNTITPASTTTTVANNAAPVVRTATANAQHLEKNVKILEVIDGDTVIITKENSIQPFSVRLIGIDTPELMQKEKYADVARSALDNNLSMFNYRAHLEYDPSQDRFDKYNRQLAYLWVENPNTGEMINLNLEQIKQGLAREYTYERDYRYKKLFVDAENTAREHNLNIWND